MPPAQQDEFLLRGLVSIPVVETVPSLIAYLDMALQRTGQWRLSGEQYVMSSDRIGSGRDTRLVSLDSWMQSEHHQADCRRR
jgi:hypothetical protein